MIKNVHGNTVDLLGEDIVSGRHPVGSALPPEPMLCETLGVSRTVIREAVKSLVAKGLLVTGPKLGTRVLPEEHWNWFDPDVVVWQSKIGFTREFLRDLQELRRVVEPAGVRLAAERATAADIAEIEAAYAGMRARWFATPRFERPTIGPGAEVLAQLHTLDIFRVGFTATREPIVPLEILHRATGALRRLTQQPTEAP